jgi:ribonuclease P protein component
VTRELSGTRVSYCFPKNARILRSSDFRKVYDAGVRISGPYFAAFCLRVDREDVGPRLGFTVARAFGRAVKRNRAKRRIREALRRRLSEIAPHWDIVLNPRRQVLTATPDDLRREVDRLVLKCAN